MPRAAPSQTAFNAGELSPRMAGRIDQGRYGVGCHVLENFIPDIAGPAVKRAGSRFVKEVKDSARRSWLVRFDFSADDSYVLEFGHLYIRFYSQRSRRGVPSASAYDSGTAYVVGDLAVQSGVTYYCIAATTGNAPPNATYWYPLSVAYEIPSPYTEAQLTNEAGGFAISYVQSGDIIYLAHGSHQTRKLSRFADDRWTLSLYEPKGGPFDDINDTATTITAGGVTGSVTLTASAGIFRTTDVGSLIYLAQPSVSNVQQWEPGKSITSGDVRRNGTRNYQALNTDTTGTVTPTHTEGAVYDGHSAVQWQFLDPGYGWARITAYTSATQVTATVLSRLPAGALSPTTKWAFGSWNAAAGWPDTVTFYLDRLVFARGANVWMTVSGDYENMSATDDGGRQTTQSAIALPVPSRRGNRILWLETLESGLVVGTGADEWLIAPASRNEPLGPLNVSATPLAAIGSRGIPPLRLFDSVVFTQRSGRKLRELKYIMGEGAARADLNAFADHIAAAGVTSLAYVAEPYSTIWATLANGSLVACTYYPEQEVAGWARMPLDGFVECVQSIPAPDGRSDDLWLIVRRTVNGVTRRYVEYMPAPLGDEDAQADAYYVDGGITYSGAATTTITGLDHLEGKTVAVLVNGATHPNRTVSSGAIELQVSGTKVHAGLPFAARLATMNIEAGAAAGTAQGRVKRANEIVVRLFRTLGGRAGPLPEQTDTLQFRSASVPMGGPPPLYTGDQVVSGLGSSDRTLRIWFLHDDPLPATVVAVMPVLVTEG